MSSSVSSPWPALWWKLMSASSGTGVSVGMFPRCKLVSTVVGCGIRIIEVVTNKKQCNLFSIISDYETEFKVSEWIEFGSNTRLEHGQRVGVMCCIFYT